MYQRHRFLVAVLAALSFLALGAFAASRSKPPQANVHKAKKIKPYKAQKINKKKQYDKTVQETPLKLGHQSCHSMPPTDKVVTQVYRPPSATLHSRGSKADQLSLPHAYMGNS